MMGDLAEVMHHFAAEPAADQRTDSQGQEREAHVRALLPRRCQARNVFVVARLVNDLAQSQHENRNSTRKNIANTLRAETRNTFSSPNFRCARSAIYGPVAPPTFTIV